jgi:NAD-dependent SIR2 family protein deacetylase
MSRIAAMAKIELFAQMTNNYLQYVEKKLSSWNRAKNNAQHQSKHSWTQR